MKITCARSLGLAGFIQLVTAAPWIVTEYQIEITSTLYPESTDRFGNFETAWLYTDTIVATPTVTSLPTDLPATTIVDRFSPTVTSVVIVLPASLGGPNTDEDGFPQYPTRVYDYYVPLTYTGPTDCGGEPWVYTTSAPAYPPAGASPSYATEATVTTSNYLNVLTTYTNKILVPTEIPSLEYSEMLSDYAPYFTDSCTIPSYYTRTSNDDPSFTSGSGFYDSNDCNYNYYDIGISSSSCLTLVTLIIAIVFSIFGFFLLAGLVQNWYSYQSLCKGYSARRGLPWLWCLMFPVLSCLFLLGSRSGFAAKSPEEQAVLKQRWREISFGTKLKQWFQWGFRHRYPTFLGPPPPARGHTATYNQHPSVPSMNISGGGVIGVPPPSFAPPQGQQGQPQYQLWNPQTNSWQPYVTPQQGVYPHSQPQVVGQGQQQPQQQQMQQQGGGLAPVHQQRESTLGSGTSPSLSAVSPVSPGTAREEGSEVSAPTVMRGGVVGMEEEALPKNEATVQELDGNGRGR